MAGKDRDILAPMPGRVVRVLVKEGQAVVPGEPVLIIEAMKMENELRAVVGGTVSAVHAKAGDGVERGALLVAIGEGE
ncbi:MAG: acetyl-CoA carboxylase biotin carboxyl carrier protein subunit [Myxococcales bacterium]|nr:acetyl-CoA carboxylase biotin carboxyl carrier protein subunit [Myxococcales bacterium]